MSYKTWRALGLICFLLCLAIADLGTLGVAGFARRAEVAQQNSTEIEFITADELKTRVAKNEPVTIIDVRGSSTVLDNDNKIKGAIYVKLRKLKSRLGLPPLKDVPRNREVVTYCACPSDESSIRAAQVLLQSGFKRVRVLKGGWPSWKKANGQVEPLSKAM
ncbi:MAG: rhodanese-like domain-containing protein [Pyrinomonadaceae bacterium]